MPKNQQLKTRPADWRNGWLPGLLLIAVTFLAYLPVWRAGFIWDDDTFLTNNPVLKRPDALFRLWFTASTPDYFPMTSSMLWVEWRLWGMHPLGYHLVNVLLHSLSAILLWRVLLRLKIPGALLAAGLFALHPVNVESVAWITERKNTLAMFFYLGSLLAWLRFEDTGQRRWYGLALGAFGLGLLSKTAVAPLPVVLLGMAWWRRGRVEWRDVRRAVPFFLGSVVLGLVTVWFQYHRSIGGDIVRPDNFWSRLAGAGWAVWFYLYKAVLPLNLIFVYPRWRIDARNVLSYLPLALVAAALAWSWLRRARWGKGWVFALGYFVVMLLPILGFLNIYFMRFSLVADYWQYFAIIGPIALVAAWIRKPLPAAALLLALGALTWHQCGMYADQETLWRATLARNPGCWMAHDNLGGILLGEGKLEEALAEYGKALEIQPDDPDARNDLGLALFRNGQTDEAIAQYRRALEIKPGDHAAHYNLGLAFFKKGELDEAIAQFQKALELRPDSPDMLLTLGMALSSKGDKAAAVGQYRKALEISPDYEAARYNLGFALSEMGDLDEAIAQYQKVLETDPNYAEARNNLGADLFAKGDLEGAIAQYRAAVKLQPAYTNALFNLGNALVRSGQLDDGIAQYRSALAVNPGYADARLNLGLALAQNGQLEPAIAQYQMVLDINPGSAEAHNDLGQALFQKGGMEDAITEYKKALAIQTNFALARNNLGYALLRKGDFEAAMDIFKQTIPMGGDAATNWFNLGNNFLQKKDFEGAISCYRQAIKINPRLPGACANLGVAYFQKGDTRSAVDSWQQALETYPDQIGTLNNLAWSLATSSDASLRNGAKAVALAEQAKHLTGGTNSVLLNTLAAAYAETGRYQDAAATAKIALNLALTQQNNALAAMLQKEIQLYQAGAPMRDPTR
jgi:tetratricopeptide (TPR) repeat protein